MSLRAGGDLALLDRSHAPAPNPTVDALFNLSGRKVANVFSFSVESLAAVPDRLISCRALGSAMKIIMDWHDTAASRQLFCFQLPCHLTLEPGMRIK